MLLAPAFSGPIPMDGCLNGAVVNALLAFAGFFSLVIHTKKGAP